MQCAVGAELAGSDEAPRDAANHERTCPVREIAAALDRGNGPDAGKAAVDARHEHNPVARDRGGRGRPLRFVGLERDRDHHLRQHDTLGEGQQGQELSLGV